MKKTIFLGFSLVFLFGFIHSATITVTSPNSGNTWWKGRTYTIQWTKTGTMDSNVKIRLRDSTSATKILDITNSTLNDGNYSWEIPTSVAPGNYRIRVRTTDKQVYGDSEAFTVIKNPLLKSIKKKYAVDKRPPFKKKLYVKKIRVISPNGGETFCGGETAANLGDICTIQWEAIEDVGAQRIKLMKGGTLKYLLSTNVYASSQGFSFRVYIPFMGTGSDYKIRIENSDGTIFDESDEFFTIKKKN